MFLRKLRVHKDGKEHGYWSLVETVRTADGPRQRTLCYLGELNGFGPRALAEDRRGLQRARREHPAEAVSLRSTSARRSERRTGASEEGPRGAHAALRRLLSGPGVMEAIGAR